MSHDNDFDFGVAQRRAIGRPFANAVPATFHVERKGWSPCKTACAVHTSAQGYVALVAAGRFAEAYRVAAEPNPLNALAAFEAFTSDRRRRLAAGEPSPGRADLQRCFDSAWARSPLAADADAAPPR